MASSALWNLGFRPCYHRQLAQSREPDTGRSASAAPPTDCRRRARYAVISANSGA
jgi:hypothetical protein